jgi:hypothetical protein
MVAATIFAYFPLSALLDRPVRAAYLKSFAIAGITHRRRLLAKKGRKNA